jgi:hypothetical protein
VLPGVAVGDVEFGRETGDGVLVGITTGRDGVKEHYAQVSARLSVFDRLTKQAAP